MNKSLFIYEMKFDVFWKDNPVHGQCGFLMAAADDVTAIRRSKDFILSGGGGDFVLKVHEGHDLPKEDWKNPIHVELVGLQKGNGLALVVPVEEQ